ncbi:MAG: 50S ribosomal protein L29 [Bacteroidetes bacterium]|nr:50S ribosomal protein L29 [Bacteroidota bacterium]
MATKTDFLKSIAELSEAELSSRIAENEVRLKKLEFAHAISPLENPMSIRSLRRDNARLKTVLRKKQIGI